MPSPIHILLATGAAFAHVSSAAAVPAAAAAVEIWKPAVGATWQIELSVPVSDVNANVSIFDFDLYDNSAATISKIHAAGKKAICYFSAGTFEDWRSDANSFVAADKGDAMGDWDGEWWLDTNSANVRKIMKTRIALAKSKGCDAIDPDNVDAYNNGNGLGLTKADAINYLTFLATEGHAQGLAVGLKNGAEIVPQLVSVLDFVVNEQCTQYTECPSWSPFIAAGKPVFHIEYPPKDSKPFTAAQKKKACTTPAGFSTVLKKMTLDSWVDTC